MSKRFELGVLVAGIGAAILLVMVVFVIDGDPRLSPQDYTKGIPDKPAEPTDVVERLWQYAREGNVTKAEASLGVTPASFYDGSLRCQTKLPDAQEAAKAVNRGELVAQPIYGKRDWAYDASLEWINKIASSRYRPRRFELLNSNEDEAIVRVMYEEHVNENGGELLNGVLFLLNRSEVGWKVFLIYRGPVLNSRIINGTFASGDCP